MVSRRLYALFGLLATLVATALGTLIALAIVRHAFRGRCSANLLVFLPMSTPEIVLGASLLTLFLNLTSVFQLGFQGLQLALGCRKHLKPPQCLLQANRRLTAVSKYWRRSFGRSSASCSRVLPAAARRSASPSAGQPAV